MRLSGRNGPQRSKFKNLRGIAQALGWEKMKVELVLGICALFILPGPGGIVQEFDEALQPEQNVKEANLKFCQGLPRP